MTDVRPIDANSIHYTRVLAQKGLNMELAAKSSIERMPTLDYAPVRHGEWVYDFTIAGDKFYRCSVCGRQENIIEKEDINEDCPYCHCGAKMDGGK